MSFPTLLHFNVADKSNSARVQAKIEKIFKNTAQNRFNIMIAACCGGQTVL